MRVRILLAASVGLVGAAAPIPPAADQIAAAGWPDPSRAAASDTTETETYVYYPSAEYEGAARGIMQLIGAVDVRMSDAFPTATITVVLGADYVPPAAG